MFLYTSKLNNFDSSKWKIFKSTKKDELLENFQVFKNYVVLETRKKGLPQLLFINKKNKKKIMLNLKILPMQLILATMTIMIRIHLNMNIQA